MAQGHPATLILNMPQNKILSALRGGGDSTTTDDMGRGHPRCLISEVDRHDEGEGGALLLWGRHTLRHIRTNSGMLTGG